MRTLSRATTLIALATAAVLASGCGAGQLRSGDAMSDEVELAAFESAIAADPDEEIDIARDADASSERPGRARWIPRRWIRRNLEHGELVVSHPERGAVTILIQHGEITDVSDDTVTVESVDGYTETWLRTDRSVVREDGDGTKMAWADLDAGEAVAVGGHEADDGARARLVVVD